MKFCMICLRTDRPVKDISNFLVEFHDELCEFSLPTVGTQYCWECKHLLKKFYTFSKQCVKALKIYVKWKSTKTSARPPLQNLHTQLPSPTIDHWRPSPRVGHLVLTDITDLEETQGVAEDIQDVFHHTPGPMESAGEDSIENETINIEDIKQEIGDASIKTMNIRDFIENTELFTESGDETVEANTKDVKDEPKIVGEELEMLEEDFLKSIACMDFDNEDDTDDEDGPAKKAVKKKPLSYEKIKADLILKLASCDEIIANDGSAIDKEMVVKALCNVTYRDWRTLRCALRGRNPKNYVSPKLKTFLNNIYGRCKEDEKYSTVFDIQYLATYEMKVEEFDKRKTYECYLKAEHKCDICYTTFRRPKDLENHTKMYHDANSDGDLCPICKVRPGKHLHKRSMHSMTHSAVYKCKMCPLVTYYRETMKKHYGMHTGKTYRCEACNTTYRCQSGYFLHMARYHRRGRHICTQCGRGFPSLQGLTTHSHIHQREPPPTEAAGSPVHCAECDVTFPSRAVHEAHVADVHVAPAPPRPRRDADSHTLPAYWSEYRRRKPRAPHKMPRIKCRLCNVSRQGAGWLKTHFKREHPNENWNLTYADSKKHLCDVCGTGFSSIFTLRDHMNIHTGARPFKCDHCPKRFRSSVLMRDHRARHFPPTNLCTHCGKKFKSKSNLFNHMKVHTGEKSHICEICGKGFLYSTTLNEHVRGVHHNIRRVRKRGGEASRGKDQIVEEEMI